MQRLTATGNWKWKGRYPRRQKVYEYECLCGKIVFKINYYVKNNIIKSCGCLHAEVAGNNLRTAMLTHGQSRSLTYKRWASMRDRVRPTNPKFYSRYWGRGIRICKRWSNFKNFLKDMGEVPSKAYTLERINNAKGYCKSNCKWLLAIHQARNRRNTVWIEYNGERRSLGEWAEIKGLSTSNILGRLKLGWSIPDTLNLPKKRK